jgi:hypothetical protein
VYSTLGKLWWAPGPRLYALWAALGVGSGGTGVCFKHEICRPKHKAMYACSRPVIVINARCVIEVLSGMMRSVGADLGRVLRDNLCI